MISKDEIKKLASISMLKFSDEELEKLEVKLSESIKHIEILDEVDTQGVEPLFQVYDYTERLREDEHREDLTLTREQVLQNTVEKQYGYFKLLNIMD